MSAILLGSIGAIAETSELQRASFNQAFALHGLGWHWPREEYVSLLEKSGGQKRIEDYAAARGQSVDAAAIHRSKSEIFQRSLQEIPPVPRPGVVETVQKAKQSGLKVALVTTTSQQNITSLLTALSAHLGPDAFDYIVDASLVKQPKPAKDAYMLAISQLQEAPNHCLAIEDNPGGVTAARAAGVPCVAFPGTNTAHYDFPEAQLRTNHLNFEELMPLMATA